MIYISYSSFNSISTTKDASGNDIIDANAANQKVYVTNANFKDGPFEVTFRTVNGKRTMTITHNGNSVTWEETTA